MRWLILSDRADGPRAEVAIASIREHHPDDEVLVLATDPARPAAAPSADRTITLGELRVGRVDMIDVAMATAPAFTRWAAIAAALVHLGDDHGVVVVHDHVVLTAPVADPLPEEGHLAVVAERVRPDGFTRGCLAEVALAAAGSGAVARAWTEEAAHRLFDDASTIAVDAPWSVRWSVPGLATDERALWRLHPATYIDAVGDGDVDGPILQLPGFAPETPWWFAVPGSDAPAVSLGTTPRLRAAIRAYAAALTEAGATASAVPSFDPGAVPDSPALRREFRRRLVAALDGGDPPPNPYRPGGTAPFIEWMRGPGRPLATGVSLFADLVWEDRPDLAAAFPHVRWADRPRFIRWLWTHGLAEGRTHAALLPTPGERPRTITRLEEPRIGVNLVGYHRAELGLGVAVRRIAAALDAEGVPWEALDYDRTNSRRREGAVPASAAPYSINLVLVTADQFEFLLDDVGHGLLEGRYTVGLWYWETDVLTEHQQRALRYVDEIWGATDYLRRVYAAHTDKPVLRMPLPLEFRSPDRRAERRRTLNLDERFTFLFSFDHLSIARRKNPLGLIEAYRRAFEPEDGCRLILKSINGHHNAVEAEQILDTVADRSDIDVWDFYLDGDDRLDLVGNVDCYVSLHRSEGLGLTMAEAMSSGVPVIATGYSGNLDFMPEGSALLVDATEVPIGPGLFYPAEGHWAEPDLDHAARLMRRVRDDADLRSHLARRGSAALAPFSVDAVGHRMGERIRAIQHGRGTPPV